MSFALRCPLPSLSTGRVVRNSASNLLSDGFGDATGLQRAQDLYALLYGRMGGEEALSTLLELLYGVDDVEVSGRAVGYLQDLLVARDLL
jgi:hypothetical protein